jgi:hypothetical protein
MGDSHLFGQSCSSKFVRQDVGWIYLDWKEPGDGGRVAACKVQRSVTAASPGKTQWTAVKSEYTLHNQPTAKSLLYQIVAINKAGEGLPSNTVSVTL